MTTAVASPRSTRPASVAGMRVLLTLCAVSFIGTTSAVAITPFLSIIADDLNTGVPLIGQTATAALLFSAAIGLLAGPLADHVGPRRLLIAGMVICALSAVASALAGGFTTFLLGRMIGGISGSILPGVSLAIAGTWYTGDARKRALSWTIAALASAGIVGVPALTLIGEPFGWRWAFGALAVVAALGIALVWRALPRDPAIEGRFDVNSVAEAYRPLLGHRPTLALYAANVLRAICWIGSVTYIGAFLTDERNLSLPTVGLIFMVAGSGYFIGSLAAGGRLGNIDLRALFATTTVIMSLLLGISFTAPLGVMGVTGLIAMAAVAGAIGWVALTTLLVTTTPAQPATTMVLNGSVFSLGSALGGAAGGLLLAWEGYGALGLGMPAFALCAATIVSRSWSSAGSNPAARMTVD